MSIRILNGGIPTPFPSTLNAPTNVTAGVPTSTTIPLTWTPTEQGSAIEYRVKDNSTNITVTTVSWPATGVNVTGLDADTEYSHYVVTSDGTKESPKSNVATARTAVAADWNLAAGHHYDNEAIIPLKLISPLSDGGTGKETVNSWARHRWAHSQFLYQYPIGVQGGDLPYKYEIIEDGTYEKPSWLSIGQFYGEANYGILNGTPSGDAQNTQWLVKILITDQTSRTVETIFTLELDDDMFRIQDLSAVGPYNGTWDEPYLDFTDWMGTLDTDTAASAGKIMVYRGGTHAAVAHSNAAYTMRFNHGDIHPMCHIGVPGESVGWDCSDAIFICTQGDTRSYNFYVADIDIVNSPGTNVGNVRIFYISGAGTQCTGFNLTFSSLLSGTNPGGSNNEACFYLDTVAGAGNFRQYFYLKNIHTDSLPASTPANGFNLFIIYKTKYYLIDGCTDSNSVCQEWAFVKVSSQYYTIRNCTLRDGSATLRGMFYGYHSIHDLERNGPFEYCYNNIKQSSSNPLWLDVAGYPRETQQGIVFRNTIEGSTGVRVVAGNQPVDYLRNVNINAAPPSNFNVPGGETNVHETSVTGVIDSSGLLEDDYLTANGIVRGTHGHEIG